MNKYPRKFSTTMQNNTINGRTQGIVIVEHLKKKTVKYVYLREIKEELIQEPISILGNLKKKAITEINN